MKINNIFSPYKDSMGAHIMELLEYLVLLFIVLWVQTGVTSGTSEYDIVIFTFQLGVLAFILKAVDFVIFLVAPSKVDKSPMQTIGFGNPWRMLWGIIGAIVIVTFLNLGTLKGAKGLSFFSTFLQFSTTYMFWFLVFIGPRIEEMFSNSLMPTLTAMIRWRFKTSHLVAGAAALFLVIAPLFAVFHYFTYFSKSGANMQTLFILMFAAYVFRCIFTLGNYFFKSDEFGKSGHMLHNFFGYWVAVGNPFKILPDEQNYLIIGVFIVMVGYFVALTLFRIGKYGFVKGLKPETILDDL